MYRNLMNRCWAFTLVCVLALVTLIAVPGPGLATTVSPGTGGGDPGNPLDPGSSGAGDPDVPTNTGRSAPVSGYHVGLGSIRHAPSDPSGGWTARNVWIFRIRTALRGIRLFYLHD